MMMNDLPNFIERTPNVDTSLTDQPAQYQTLLKQRKILINQLGYESNAPKIALLSLAENDRALRFNHCILKNLDDGESFSLNVEAKIGDQFWGGCAFQKVDFSHIKKAGNYQIIAEDDDGKILESLEFTLKETLYWPELSNKILSYFNSQRCAEQYQIKDKSVSFSGRRRQDQVDVSGGWYDASGDLSKYLSHLSYANYMNPQQTPLVVYALASAVLKDELITENRNEWLDEAIWGGDFLLNMFDEEHFFYQTVFDQWSGELEKREICEFSTQLGHRHDTFEAGFRQGGGIAIAALARLSRIKDLPEAKQIAYEKAAKAGFAHLCKNNEKYLNDGRENIIDVYCALYAANNLYAALDDDAYLQSATKLAMRLMKFMKRQKDGQSYWFMDDAFMRPFNHAADEGMPLIALIDFYEVAPTSIRNDIVEHVLQTVKLLIDNSEPKNNPFAYPRHLVKKFGKQIEQQFFYPHDNESGYWWQGENARLGSLITSVNKALALNDKEAYLSDREQLQLNQLKQSWQNWILGQNPFHTSMFQGVGVYNPQYNLAKIPNQDGGICNGITSDMFNEQSVAFCQTEDELQSWRWSEQWLPHSSWFLLALLSEN